MKEKPAPLKDAIAHVVKRMTGIMTRQEFVAAVLPLYPTKAKDPASAVMNEMRWRKDIVPLGNSRYARTDFVLNGARFRVPVTATDLALGVLSPQWFHPFNQVLTPHESHFVSVTGETIPLVKKGLDAARLSAEQLDTMLGGLLETAAQSPLSLLGAMLTGTPATPPPPEELDEEAMLAQAREKLKKQLAEKITRHDFTDYFAAHQVQAGDSLLVTMLPQDKTYLFQREPAAQADAAQIAERDAELQQFIRNAIQRNQREYARDVIFQAYGNLPWLKEYPGSHWQTVIENDDELRLIQMTPELWEIASIDYRMMLDNLGVDEATERKLAKRRAVIEGEVAAFRKRLQADWKAAQQLLTNQYDRGGKVNIIAAQRPAEDYRKRYARNNQLIQQFFQAEKTSGKKEATARQKASDLALFADYLSSYANLTLEYAGLDELEDFLFDWYPRKVLDSTAKHAQQLAASLRDFYRFLVTAQVIRRAQFAEALYQVRDLAGEKIALYNRLPDDGGELFGQLFSGW